MSTDSSYTSTSGQTLSVSQAANRLQDAIKSLEGALTPMASRLKALEAGSEEASTLQEDRARLARELDDAKALNAQHATKEAQWEQTEKEFSELAGETMAELDAVIRQVQHALGQGGGSA